MLALTGIRKRYPGALDLGPIDLDLRPGSTSALIGPSGCGKSTVLRIAIGLVEPDSGEVRLDGERMTADSVLPLRRRMGYVIQDGGLFPHLTARRNVTLVAEHLRWEPARVDARLDALADLVRMPRDVLERVPTEISGGQRQRVALMRALMLDPDVLLLDEPLGALDPMIRSDLQEDLAAIFEELHKSVVLVTHDLAEAAFFADRIVLLRDGRIVQTGHLEDLIARPAEPFVRDFVHAQRVLHAGGSA